MDTPEHEILTRVCRGVASTQEGERAMEIILDMLKDAKRYEFLREHWGRLVTHTFYESSGGPLTPVVSLIEVKPQLSTPDPQSLDQAVDSAIEREDENERAAAKGDQQDDLSGPTAQRCGI